MPGTFTMNEAGIPIGGEIGPRCLRSSSSRGSHALFEGTADDVRLWPGFMCAKALGEKVKKRERQGSFAGRGILFGALFGLAAALVTAVSILQAQSEENAVCLECHGDIESWDEASRAMYVDKDRFGLSVHGQAGLTCTACHEDLDGVEDFPHSTDLAAVDCSGCHDEEGVAFEESIHRKPGNEGNPSLRCRDCHGDHYILPVSDPNSMVYRANLPLTCSRCHSTEPIDAKKAMQFPGGAVKSYLKSVHGKALVEQGLIVSAVCVDCHGSHDIQLTSSPRSPISKENVPRTCGKCHAGILVAYSGSIHGVALMQGNPDVPVCTDCHGEHIILPPDVKASPVYPTNIPVTCSKCHDNKKLDARYGLPVNRYKTYMSSYHGIASRLGDVTVANCASCHGVHDIKPSSDPTSSINPRNLTKTCGKCHPGSSKQFVSHKIHVEKVEQESLGASLAKKFYSIFIPSLVGFFVIFIGVELYGSIRRKRGEDSS